MAGHVSTISNYFQFILQVAAENKYILSYTSPYALTRYFEIEKSMLTTQLTFFTDLFSWNPLHKSHFPRNILVTRSQFGLVAASH